MKIYFLGTNGWFTTPTGNTSCILIDSKEGYIIFDAGNGIYKVEQYIKENKPVSLFISHFHLDHVSGLHTFAQFEKSQGLDIYMAEGRKKDFDTLVNPPYTSRKAEIRIHELSEGKTNTAFPLEVFRMKHAYENHAFRVTLEEKVIAYSGDTGICDNSIPFAKDADLLIHECSFIKAPVPENWGHVDPIQAGTLAKDADVKKLILTHFDAAKYSDLEKRDWAEKEAKNIFPNTIAAKDGLTLTL